MYLSLNVRTYVQVTFWSSNPRSNRTTQGTYLTVEQQLADDWAVILVDGVRFTKNICRCIRFLPPLSGLGHDV